MPARASCVLHGSGRTVPPSRDSGPIVLNEERETRGDQTSGTTQSPVARYWTFLAMETAWSAKRSW